jgi:hypothetical protein
MSQNLGQMLQKQAQDQWRRNMEGAHWLATKQKRKNRQFEAPKRWHPVRALMKLLLLLALIVAVIVLLASALK